MPITNKATVTQWNEEKGFGFVTANGSKYFFHISALGYPVRSPKIGDTIIIISFEKTEQGIKIKKGILEGVALREEQFSSDPTYRKNRWSKKIMLVIATCIALLFAFDIYVLYTTPKDTTSNKKVCLLKENPAEKEYTSRLHVAKFICDNDRLPIYYVTKSEGIKLYEQKTGKKFVKWNFNPHTTLGVMIGGDYFDNREGKLPTAYYYEADVDYFGDNRGTNRLVYSSGCNIYYTTDHYKTFVKIEFRRKESRN